MSTPTDYHCNACNADPGEPCRPHCIGEAAMRDDELKLYEATITVVIQCSSFDEIPETLMEALNDHDAWPVTVKELDTTTQTVSEIWFDHTTGQFALIDYRTNA